MSVDGVRTSVFTFQSAVHSVHVLRSLDQQRQMDVLCDVSVEVEKQSFRAHSSVLACCSAYFYSRLPRHSGWNLVITLPDEVTVEGFVPLLQFAYTAKLHFTKENILEIHRCAEVLGFHNLDKACFDFLIPKFSDGSRTTQEAKGRSKTSSNSKTCQEIPSSAYPEPCPSAGTGDWLQPSAAHTELRSPAMSGGQCPEEGPHATPGGQCPEEGPHATSSGQCPEEGPHAMPNGQCHEEGPHASSNKDVHLDSSLVTLQVAGGQDGAQLCLQNCGPQLLESSSVTSVEVCPFLSLPCTSGSDAAPSSPADCDGGALRMGEVLEDRLTVDAGDATPETSAGEDLNVPSITKDQFEQPLRAVETSAHSALSLCPLSSTDASEVLDTISSVSDLKSTGTESMKAFCSPEPLFPDPAQSEGCAERSTDEREVAEHLAKGFWPDLSSSLTETLESVHQAAVGNGSDFHWLRHLDLGAAPDDCPFLRDLSNNEGRASQRDTESKHGSGEESCGSTINSGENSDCDTESDCMVRVAQECEADLPVPAEQISSMSRRAFLRMLKEQRLSAEQLELVQDVRRRSKNRMAAQRCRKRKLDCIYRLEGDIKKLRIQKEKLLQERQQLKLNMEDVRQSLSRLCQTGYPETSAAPEGLRLLPRHLPSDCPAPETLTSTAPEGLRLLPRHLPSDCPAPETLTSTAPEGLHLLPRHLPSDCPAPGTLTSVASHPTCTESCLSGPQVNRAGVTLTSASLPADGTHDNVADSVT